MRNLIVTALALTHTTHADTQSQTAAPQGLVAPDMAPTSTPPVIDISGNIIDQMRAFNPPLWVRPGVAIFNVVWGEVTPPVPMEVEMGGISGMPPDTAGTWDGKVIRVASWGKKENALRHRGGLEGTVVHEFAHVLQCLGTDNDLGGWYFTNHHDEQSALFQKWKSVLAGAYAGEQPYEATAEVFRVLKGYKSGEEWENNSQLLKEWEDFLKGNEVFKHFFP